MKYSGLGFVPPLHYPIRRPPGLVQKGAVGERKGYTFFMKFKSIIFHFIQKAPLFHRIKKGIEPWNTPEETPRKEFFSYQKGRRLLKSRPAGALPFRPEKEDLPSGGDGLGNHGDGVLGNKDA